MRGLDMHNNSAIFAVSIILLVPFAYATFSISDACAAAHHPRYATGTCTGDDNTGKTCCWREQKEGSILGDTYCQTCTLSYDPKTKLTTEKCGLVTKQLIKPPTTDESGPLQGGGVLEDPATSPKLEGNVGPRGEFQELPENNMTFSEGVGPNAGGVFEQLRDNNLTFSQTNNSSNTSALGELQSDVENDAEENNEETHEEGQQDQSEESEDSNEEEEEE
jgi:hypothetical protein